MSRRVRPYERPQRRNGCLVALVLLIWVAVGLVVAYQFLVRPQISRQVGREVTERVDQRGRGMLPTVIAALPEGEVQVQAIQINSYIAANLADLAPLEAAEVRFAPGRIIADIRAFGFDARATMGAAIINGRIVAVDPQLDGPLAQLISIEELLVPIEAALNDELMAQGRTYTSIEILQDTVIVR
ncbi:MAG TPA: hypothetical protein PKA05_04740 [Roseiflexaceae bacterium]|nr:hypothetical protein [Roseiflexaceae bacterium]HMP39668.1 hypothetical protein [Roseiflexaceae bacterium]